MAAEINRMQDLIDQAKTRGPIRLAVIGAGQGLVLDTVQQAKSLGLVEPCLIGNAREITALAKKHGWDPATVCAAAVDGDAAAAKVAADLVRSKRADAIMKGNIHTDAMMRVLLHEANGLRVPGRRASHVFLVEVPSYRKLLCITDAAMNIAPDLIAKAQILQNAVDVTRLLRIEIAKVAVLSAVETVNPAIVSTLDAAALTLMARRGQITGVLVDGPLAFDNAISENAAKEKGIVSEVVGNADIILVPDLVSGNILAKTLEYLAGATLAGIVVGLAVPVILTSRADPVPARLASIALAVLLHKQGSPGLVPRADPKSTNRVVAQSEAACCPLPA
jgi:phosphotransacetylase